MQEQLKSVEQFGPDLTLVGFWIALVSPPLIIAILCLIRYGATNDVIKLLATGSFLPLLLIVFCSRFRVSFSSTHFSYRRWGKTVTIAYRDMKCIEVANVTPIAKTPIGAFVVAHDGVKYPFWPKLFPREAVKRFMLMAERC